MGNILRNLFVIWAIAEIAPGLALVTLPGLVGHLLLDVGFDATTQSVARVAGLALIGLGVACLPDSVFGGPRRGMATYSGLVALYLAYLGMTGTANGVLLWPVIALHAVLALLFVWPPPDRGKD